ncbi:hypothetical protein DFH11DRAFT_1743782 [Phellopilus nigrolimitatus]|nr:hypothetical protein DFH11DRAFT_1743782 [Phellopilus nigrolimitatus]
MEIQPWERALKQPTFEFAPQSSPTVQTTRPARTRNMKPCRNCADVHEKCNISPPYSSGTCEACTTARVPCPPHKGRKSRKKVTRARLVQDPPLLGSVPDVLQPPFPSGNEAAEVIQPQITRATGAPAINAVSETSSDDAAAGPHASQIGFDVPIIADESFDLFSIFTPGREDWFSF